MRGLAASSVGFRGARIAAPVAALAGSGVLAIAATALAALLAGCGDPSGRQDDLGAWMRQQDAIAPPKLRPLPVPKPFIAQAYTAGAAGDSRPPDPFDPARLTQALRQGGATPELPEAVVLELQRRKDLLEAFPLDALRMAGTLRSAGRTVALVSVDQRLYPVRVGDRMGLNHGRVVAIRAAEIELRERVLDSTTHQWIERLAKLELQ